VSDERERVCECDLVKDRTWTGQFTCTVHGVWFRHGGDPVQCPAGYAFDDGLAIGRTEGAAAERAAIVAWLDSPGVAGSVPRWVRDGVANIPYPRRGPAAPDDRSEP
jgi:hypothetical protein